MESTGLLHLEFQIPAHRKKRTTTLLGNVIKLMALAPTGNQSKGNTSKTGDCFGGVFLQNGHDQ